MPTHIALHHQTRYGYDRPVALGPQTVRLRPAPHARARILSYSLRVAPEKHFINWQQDPQSNYLARLVFPEKTRELLVEVDLVVEMAVFNPFDFFLEPEAERVPFQYDARLDHELGPFQLKCEATPLFKAYAGKVARDFTAADAEAPLRTVDFLVNVNQGLWREIEYLIRLEPGVQTPEETLARRGGSCRDSAWLLCQVLRHCGLAARFVSGYLIQLKPDVKSLDGPSGSERDFTDLHAWCEVYLPGAGWVGLDPTSGLFAGEGHIPLAATPDPQSAAPISGAVEDCQADLSFDMSIRRIYESPRVTKPYTEEQWSEIENLGHSIDSALQSAGCRLTMGGEPTFVSIDDMDGAEWTTEALGAKKRLLAHGLIRRLQRRFAPGALLHCGEGKWYPGESLPRWALACYWRKDGQPVWTQDALFALEDKNYGHGEKRAEQFIHELAERLGCGTRWILPAYEDTWYYLWKERRLPVNVDPFNSQLRNEEDRVRLARIFEQGLDKLVGFALPLQFESEDRQPAWRSGPWFFRPGRCYLIPGDSPMGLRLPLDSLPWVKPGDSPQIYEPEPFETYPPLPPYAQLRQAFVQASGRPARASAEAGAPGPAGQPLGRASAVRPGEESVPGRGESAAGMLRTALCVEPRHGRLHVFMPPVETLEAYLDLTAAVEATAAALDTPVVVEGYTPPLDPRLNGLKVTPDPGVIEVNMHPTACWDEMVLQTEGLYEEARLSRLGTEKFMVDGRHSGTGGGNHIVLGGPSPQESPLLRRPDLLRSLLVYWQNHPSLSFLFSSLFLGPTSQSPRVDEARHDSLYELEIAFDQVPERAEAMPWVADRLFRHLLVDATGNTHRAEFCIDKLFPPESSGRRLGLLEMRAFEMPPHARMSLAQQLLLRTLVAKLWAQPCSRRLVRWGTDIHDRWMLPHFIWDDFQEVIEELQQAGYAIRGEWFAPHFEFRFPLVGGLEARNIHLELRQALEPWHVLGEEPGAVGTVRYVDSSLERLQVKLRGLVDQRYALSVNRRPVPLHPTGTNGEYVAGVRFRAWQPPSCLHPTIPVHTPLVFDLVDTWNRRSIAGCTYHVMHPGGRHYENFPVNAYEAESRRLARFFRSGHSPGPLDLPQVLRHPESPFTLDLRK